MTELYRAVRTVPIDVPHRFTGLDGEAAGVVTGVTAAARSAAGNAIVLPAPTAGTDGVYTVRMPGVPTLDQVTITWSATLDGATITDTDVVEVAGGHYFTPAAARAADPDLQNTVKYPTATLTARRLEVEQECEAITGRAWVPRFALVTLDGTDDPELILPDPHVRAIRSVTVTGAGGTSTVWTPDQVAGLVVRPADRVVVRPAGAVWPAGRGNLVIGYDHGVDAPPPDLRRAAMVRLKSWLMLQKSGIPLRAESWTDRNGTTYRLTLPDAYSTGIPDVDAVYDRYSLRPSSTGDTGAGGGGGGNAAPASRTLNFDPQRYSLFHGGVR